MTSRSPDLWRLTIDDAASLLRSGEVSAVDLTRACLERIDAVEPTLNAFITITAERALAQAAAADRDLAAGHLRGPLHGLPLSLKDLFDVAGLPTTAGGSFDAPAAAHDSAVTARLAAAGTVLLGKTGLHEHAFGVTSDNPHFGAVSNPWAAERIPGGSSGGSAASIAAGCGFGSIGSDTGGSIRIPAALCGVVGLKPTRGRVSLRGAAPLAWTLDHAGPIARSVRDTALLYAAVAGHDPLDPGSRSIPAGDPLAEIDAGVRGLRIGLWRDALEQADAPVRAVVEAAIALLSAEGAAIEEIDLPSVPSLRPPQRTIICSEAYAVHRERLERHPGAYGTDVRERLLVGRELSAADLAVARRTRSELRALFDARLAEFDAVVLPTTVAVAPPREGSGAVETAIRLTMLTSPFNLTGLPAISVPCGLTEGLPVGLQIVGRRWGEARLIRVARAYERARGDFPMPTVPDQG